MTTINARTDNSISAKYTISLLWGSCTAGKATETEAINDPSGCTGAVDTYHKAGRAIKHFSNRVGRTAKDKLDFANWLAEKGGYQFPKVLVLIEELRRAGLSPRRIDQLVSLASEAAGASQDPNEQAAGVTALANTCVELGLLNKGQAQLVSLQKLYCHYSGSMAGQDGKEIKTVETDLCYNRNNDYGAVALKIVDKQLSAGQYDEALKTAGALPLTPNLRTDIYLTIAGKALDEKADGQIAERSLGLATINLAKVTDQAAKNFFKTELDRLRTKLK